MSRSRVVVAAVATALVGLALGYGVAIAFNRSPDSPINPIQLEGPLPSPTSLPTSTTAGTQPAFVPPPTFGPSTAHQLTTTQPPITPHPQPSAPDQVATVPPPQIAPAPPPADDDDVVDQEVDDEVARPEGDDE